MSQSFDKHIGKRLRGYTSSPPPKLKKAIFSKLDDNDSKGISVWQVTGIVIFVVSLLQIVPHNEQVDTSAQITQKAPSTTQTKLTSPPYDKGTNAQLVTPDTINSIRESVKEISQYIASTTPIQPKEQVQNQSTSGSSSLNIAPANQKTPGFVQLSNKSRDEVNHNKTIAFGDIHDLMRRKFKEADITPHRPILVVIVHHGENKGPNIPLTKEIKPQKRKVKPYADAGLFFQYQQAQPNVDDELVISNFSGLASISPQRAGAILEGGIHYELNKRIMLNAGIAAQTYRQDYSFAIHDFEPDQVGVVSGERVTLLPVYEEDIVDINHQMFSTGGKLIANFYVFPSRANILYAGMEFQKVLNPNHTFDYDGNEYAINYPDQWLASAGLRKLIFEGNTGNLYVIPSIRFALNKDHFDANQVLSLKPYSVGVSISYLMGK
ncbi:MAG: hypothetical protein JXQ90_00820 [Cyclobacteriaceae bacterium]